MVTAALVREGRAITRGEVQRWIDDGRVLVDTKAGNPSSKVRAGQTIDVTPGRPAASEALPDASVVFTVLFEDEALLVLDKPAGLVVHPAKGHETGTLVNGLLARGGFDLPPEGEGPLAHVRPGIVHRLDKGTSGVMVVAKRADAREGLKRLFATHDIERRYLALVAGQNAGGTLRSLHARHPSDRLRFTTHTREGKTAVTHVSSLARFGTLATKVACELETGRTHQIRVHLAELSRTPVLGDPVYGQAKEFEPVRAIHKALSHQALHASVLGFVHPLTQEKLRFETPPPADFLAAEAALAAAANK